MKTQSETSAPQAFWTREQAAKAAGVSVRTIQNWQSAGIISVVTIGRVVRVIPETFKAEIARFTKKAVAAA